MYIQYGQNYIKTAKPESQDARFFPADVYQAILKKKEQKVKDNQNVNGKVDGHTKASGLLGVYMTSF